MNRIASVIAALLAVGCYQTNEGEVDAGPRVDATIEVDAGSECVPLSITMPALACPPSVLPGEPAVIRVSGAHGGCCSRGTLDATVRSTGSHRHELALAGTACECCELCPCIGPTLETEVVLDGLAAGTHTVRAGDASCSFEVLEEGACAPMPVDEVRAPAVLFSGQTFGFTAWAPSSGCGCGPDLTSAAAGFDASLCGCCDACECVDPTYEVAYLGDLPASPLRVGGATVEVERRELTSCASIVGELEVVAPRDDVRRGGPAIWWAHMTGESMYAECCGARAGIETAVSADFEHRVVLRDCTFPCRCAGPPAQLDAWFPLGELAPGTHRVAAPGDQLVIVNVPAP